MLVNLHNAVFGRILWQEDLGIKPLSDGHGKFFFADSVSSNDKNVVVYMASRERRSHITQNGGLSIVEKFAGAHFVDLTSKFGGDLQDGRLQGEVVGGIHVGCVEIHFVDGLTMGIC